jgi:hypothetical protein
MTDHLVDVNKKIRRATVDLSSLNVPALDRPIAFTVFAHDSDPHDTGVLTVSADTEGLRMRWTGDKVDEWSGTWSDLRWFLQALQRDAAELRRRDAEMEALRAQVALGQEMADDIVRETFANRVMTPLRIATP